MTNVKLLSSMSYHILLAKFGEIHFGVDYEFPTCPHTLLLISQSNHHHFLNTWLNKDLTPNPLGRHHGVCHNAKPMKHHKNGLHLNDFLKYKCKSYLNQPLTLQKSVLHTSSQIIDLSLKSVGQIIELSLKSIGG